MSAVATIGHISAPCIACLPTWWQGGILPARRFALLPDGRVPGLVDLGIDDFYRPLLDLIGQHAVGMRIDGAHGTIGGRVISAPVDAGEWHRDSGAHALRVAVTWAPAYPNLAVGHEFRSGVSASGEVVAFTSAEHRRPRVPLHTPRIFASVSLYARHTEADLSCPLLVELRR